MKTTEINRFSPLYLSNGTVLRNRVVIPPMASQTADDDGRVTQTTLDHYQRLSAAQIGLLLVEYSFVHETGKSEANQLGIHRDDQVAGLSRLAKSIQRTGAKAGIQITHAGGKTERALTGGYLMAPSQIPVPVKDKQMETPTAMSLDDIALWKSAFMQGVDRAVAAGFDLVEFHSAHGYGLNQWISPLTNQRDDEYGRDHAGRTRLLIEIVSAAREKYPSLALSVRMPGQDFSEAGLSVQDAIAIARQLESSGVNIINVSSGIGGWKRPGHRRGEGYLVDEATEIQNAVQIPVIGVGGIENGEFIDRSLLAKRFSLAAVGRAILNCPHDWAAKNLTA